VVVDVDAVAFLVAAIVGDGARIDQDLLQQRGAGAERVVNVEAAELVVGDDGVGDLNALAELRTEAAAVVHDAQALAVEIVGQRIAVEEEALGDGGKRSHPVADEDAGGLVAVDRVVAEAHTLADEAILRNEIAEGDAVAAEVPAIIGDHVAIDAHALENAGERGKV